MQKVNKIIAICSAGELYGGVEQWVVSFVDRVKGQGARGKEHFEQGQGARGKGQESLGSESFDQSVAGPMTHAPCPFDIIVVLFWDGELAHRLRQIGVEPIIIKTKGTYDLSVFKKIRQVLKEKNVAIVHTHGFKADVLCGIAAMQSGIPRVKTQHGAIEMKDALSVSSFKMRMNIVLSRFMEPFFQKIIFVTHDLMRKRWIKTKKMTVIHNGIGKPQAASGKSHDSVLGEGDTRQQGRPDPIPGRPDPIPGRPDPIPGRPGSIPGRPRESGDLGTEVPDKPSA
ncbi:MAG: glycosyltransferase, partial [Candidatus Omnitrophica bacterium]|nr:glycosyltransferase [Candidatus Omnitrophota bacterium]